MESRLSLVLRNDLGELERMSQAVSAWCRANAVSAEAEYQVNLALDEIVSNVIHHGWKDDGAHQLHVRVSCAADELTLEVEDDAVPFNPLEAPAPDVTKPLAERPVGGLGIHLVRQIMDGLEYRRQDGKNLLVMKKKMGGA
jgi:anti-sigma regulatory factor (Ser/Thr protein kinase)